MIERLILAGTNEDDLILDPFAGTGTTGIGAQKHNRKWTMIEKEELYNQIARQRLEELTCRMMSVRTRGGLTCKDKKQFQNYPS